MIPQPMTKDQLLEVLKDITHLVEVDDSFEGNINYMMPNDTDPPDAEFMVTGVYRVGNSMGQGGMRMIGEVPAT